MSAEPRPAPTELETVVNWRLVGAASAAAVVLLVVPVGLALLLGPAAPRPQAAPAVPPVALAPQVPHFVLPERPYQPPPAPAVVVEWRPARSEAPPPPALKEVARTRPAPAAPSAQVVATARHPAAQPVGFRRWNRVSDYALLTELARAPEVDLRAKEETVAKVEAAVQKAQKDAAARDKKSAAAPPVEPLPDLLAQRPDLNGLPFRMGADCRAPAKAVRMMGDVSTRMRRVAAQWSRREAASLSQSQADQRGQALVKYVKCQQEWHNDDGASTVVQILQPETVYARREAVKWLSGIRGPRASAALANLAVFDPSAEVREDAVAALGKRPRAEYRDALLRGLRYPWLPAADHAAEALVELRDGTAVPALVGLLDQPDPAAPARKGGKWVVSDLVRVNHMRNCYLCHAPALSVKDPIPGVVPTPGRELPVVYYESARGPFVRADVTYLRQDFSLMQQVAKPDKWPAWQRFDFLVRTRELPAKEAAALDKNPAPPHRMFFPQREAVLFALRELTGEDLGKGSADWGRFLLGPWLGHEL
jgi:hypothetical protein